MENKVQDKSKKGGQEQLLNELLENINRQLALDMKLKETMESFIRNASRRRKAGLLEEKANIIRDCYIEAESLQAEGRAIFHQLFGTEYE
jgi:hypothetical protein